MSSDTAAVSDFEGARISPGPGFGSPSTTSVLCPSQGRSAPAEAHSSQNELDPSHKVGRAGSKDMTIILGKVTRSAMTAIHGLFVFSLESLAALSPLPPCRLCLACNILRLKSYSMDPAHLMVTNFTNILGCWLDSLNFFETSN